MRPHIKGISALFEYIDAKVANIIPAATVLAGWPALPWAQRGAGPRPAALDAIIESGVTLATLDNIINDCFNLDSSSPPQYMLNGSLRPVLQAAFASIVMYFKERMRAGEMRPVQIKMKEAVVRARVATAEDAEGTLERWGAAVRRKFDVDNIGLNAKVG